MFSDDYKKEIENIKPDGYIKQKVLNKINEDHQEKPKLKPRFNVIYRAVSVAAALALVVTGMSLLRNIKPKLQYTASSNYSEIYKVVKEYEDKYVYLYNGGINAEGDFADEDDAVATKPSTSSKTSGTAKPGASANTNAPTKDDAGDISGNVGYNSDKQESANDRSETNNQVEGVEEADVVKTDGEYIYYFTSGSGNLKIVKAGKEPKLMCDVSLLENKNEREVVDVVGDVAFLSKDYFNGEIYLSGNKLIVTAVNHDKNDGTKTIAYIYDVTDKTTPKKVYECSQSGSYNTSRLIGNKLYLISDYSVNLTKIDEAKPRTYVPCGNGETLPAGCITVSSVRSSLTYTVVCSFNIDDGNLISSQSVLGGTYALYCSTENIIIANYQQGDTTPIVRYSINDGEIKMEASGEIKGSLLNQFSIDEHNGYFRFVTTYQDNVEYKSESYTNMRIENKNGLFVLDSNLQKVGEITDLAPNERVYSVRFMGDTAYFVTFRQVDPLFSADLSDPKNPKIIGKLKIPGFSNYLFPYGEGKLLGIGQDADERTGIVDGLKLSMFDISDPSDVTESSKTVLKENYSPALYDHKASLVDYQKNLIGFAVYGQKGLDYRLFRLTENGFKTVLNVELFKVSEDVRGLYIGDELYIISQEKMLVYSMTDFTKIAELEF